MTSKPIPKAMKKLCEFRARKSDANNRDKHQTFGPKGSQKHEKKHEQMDTEKIPENSDPLGSPGSVDTDRGLLLSKCAWILVFHLYMRYIYINNVGGYGGAI